MLNENLVTKLATPVGYFTAFNLNIIGYDGNIEVVSRTEVVAPLWSDVLDWLKRKHGKDITIKKTEKYGEELIVRFNIVWRKGRKLYSKNHIDIYDNEVDAAKDAISKALKIIEDEIS